MSRAVLEDKVRGGWAGQMIGVAFGAPTEFKSNGKINEAELEWTPDMIENTIHQDDLYVEMTFAEVMDRVGLDATTEQYGEMFRDSKYSLWHANAGARRNLQPRHQGPDVGPPRLQRPRERHRLPDRVRLHRPHEPGAAPGLEPLRRPRRPGDELRRRALRRDALRGDVRRRLLRDRPAPRGRAGPARDPGGERLRAAHPRRAGLARPEPDGLAEDLAARSRRSGTGTTCARTGRSCPFNIDARINGAYVVLGLLYGDGDFAKTLEISTRVGAGLRLQPVERGGDPRRHARLRADPGEVEGRDPGPRRHEVRVHAATRSTRS